MSPEAQSIIALSEMETWRISLGLTALNAKHFNAAREAVNWCHVGTLESYLGQPRAIGYAPFNEGEHTG